MGSVLSLLTAGSTHDAEQSKIDAKRLTIDSSNQKEAAVTSLQRFSQSLANQRKMKAGGSQYDAQTLNLASRADANTTSNFQRQIQAASEMGSAVAMAGAAGVGGSSVETYQRTLALRQSVNDEAIKRAQDAQQINGADARSAIISDTIASLDNTQVVANMDYTQLIDHQKQQGIFGAFAAAAAATYFGGPKAGMAILDIADAGGRLSNNDRTGAASALSSAAGNALGALQYFGASSSGTKADSGVNVAQGLKPSSSGTSGGFWGSTESYKGYNLFGNP